MLREGLLLIIRRYYSVYKSDCYMSCVYVDWLLAGFRTKPIKTFTRLFQNCSWDLTGLLPYPVDRRYVRYTDSDTH